MEKTEKETTQDEQLSRKASLIVTLRNIHIDLQNVIL